MKQINLLVLLMFIAVFSRQPVGHAAEDNSDFFGIKKFVQKSAAAGSSKKKVKNLPAYTSSRAAGTEGNSELTEEEKKMIKEMAEKAPKDTAGAVDLPTKEKVKLPPGELSSLAPKNPPLVPKAPILVPRNPNDRIIRIPQPPSRVPQNPNGLTEQGPPTAPPGTKKKP